MRAFRFGVQVVDAPSASAWADTARKVEGLGFDVLSAADHLVEILPPLLPLLAAAEATTTLRVGTLVLNNDFRHPVVLAREAAALDLLTEGRFELGIGAGHARPEYEEAGLTFDPAPTRVERLGESLAIVKGLLGGEEVTFAGQHYRVSGHRAYPLPAQRPHPPILVGGNGPSLLRLAAREADIVGFSGTGRTKADGQTHEATGFPPMAVEERVALVREAAGNRFEELELNALVQAVIVTDDRAAAAERLRKRLPELSVEEILGTPYLLVGSVGHITEQLHERRERFGISYFSVRKEAMDAMAPVVTALAGQ